jgi:hypothetical protein
VARGQRNAATGPFVGLLLAAVLAASAGASPAQRIDLRIDLKPHTFKTITTPQTIPGNAKLGGGAWANGAELACWNDGPQTLDCAGKGVIVRVQMRRSSGPAVVRMASVRSGRVVVRVLLEWS